jgi:hypothetical protein
MLSAKQHSSAAHTRNKRVDGLQKPCGGGGGEVTSHHVLSTSDSTGYTRVSGKLYSSPSMRCGTGLPSPSSPAHKFEGGWWVVTRRYIFAHNKSGIAGMVVCTGLAISFTTRGCCQTISQTTSGLSKCSLAACAASTVPAQL